MNVEAQAAMLPPPEPVVVAETSLLLDFDGTLVPIAEEPEAVVMDDALAVLLARLHRRFEGRVAIISGRSLEQLDNLLGPVARRLSLSGSHGTEHRRDGVDARPPRPAALDDVADRFRAFAARHPGVLVEVKSFGVGLHYRRAPEQGVAVDLLAEALAVEHGLICQPGQMVAEIRLPGSDKGTAVTRLMEHAPMRGTRPVYLGDDETDEAGFATAVALGGLGIAVGPRPSRGASRRLDDPAAVRDWLEALA